MADSSANRDRESAVTPPEVGVPHGYLDDKDVLQELATWGCSKRHDGSLEYAKSAPRPILECLWRVCRARDIEREVVLGFLRRRKIRERGNSIVDELRSMGNDAQAPSHIEEFVVRVLESIASGIKQAQSKEARPIADAPCPRELSGATVVTPEPRSGTHALWQVHEPTDRADPVSHEVGESLPAGDGWCVVAASVRGKHHAHRALWRDDSYALGRQDAWHVLVVGDGAGSSRLSRVGSRVACDAMRNHLMSVLAGKAVPVRDIAATQPKEEDLLPIKSCLTDGVKIAIAALRVESEGRGIAFGDLSTTLLALIHAPWNGRHLIACVQVGDGAMGLWNEPSGITVMGQPDSGEFSGETLFLTSGNIETELDRRVYFHISKSLAAAAVMTDGVADDYFPADQRLPDLFREVLPSVAHPNEPKAALLEWIKYEKKGSSDDRTVALLYRSPR